MACKSCGGHYGCANNCPDRASLITRRAEREKSEQQIVAEIERFNQLFEEKGLPICANCQSMQEVYNTVSFIMDAYSARNAKLNAIKEIVGRE